jgi:succinate dehydrogenase flavin-adding protein (antitoxin of CptAB toxin-antitoxin module)
MHCVFGTQMERYRILYAARRGVIEDDVSPHMTPRLRAFILRMLTR